MSAKLNRDSTRQQIAALRGDGVLMVALLLLFVPALQPLLRAEFTCGYDNVFHLWRAVQIDNLWSQGVLYARWAPDMAHGFGFPLFVFMPPGTAIAAAFLHRAGLAWPVAVNALFALGMVASGLLMFCLARDLFGPLAGMVAAVAYVYAPFLAYDVFNRGSLSESVAWVFPPLILWSIQGWAVRGGRRFLFAGALGLAALMLSHQVFAFLFAPLLALWVLMNGYLTRDWRVVWRGVLLGGLGLGVSAFFWLPPLFEQSWVQTGRLLGTWVFDYHNNFLSLGHVLALPRAADPQLINDWPQKALGLIPVVIGLLPLARWRRYARETRWQVGLLWLVTVTMTALVLPLSVGLWEWIPLLPYIQFPWRYLGPAAFCLALLAGAVVAPFGPRLRPGWGGFMVTVGLALVPMLANLGWFFPRVCAAPETISLAAMIAWERATDTLGTTAKGEYLPVWVNTLPDDGVLDPMYAAGEPVVRLSESSLPAGAAITRADYGAVRSSIDLETPVAFQARYLAFYYPGWQARVDGVAVDVTPEPETGLVTFPVPAGVHAIEVWFGETPTRWLADGIAVLSTVVLGISVIFSHPKTHDQFATSNFRTPTLGPKIAFLVFGIAWVVFKLQVVDGRQVLWRHTRLQSDGTLAPVQYAFNVNFGERALLLGVDGLPERFASDDAPVITLYWRALRPGTGDWHVGLTLVGADETRWPIEDMRPARWSRTPPPLSEWPSGDYARMDNHVDVTPGMPPGTYTVMLSLFDRRTLSPASVLAADGNPLGPELVLGQVMVGPPASAPSLAELGVPTDAAMKPCGALGLWAMTADRTQVSPGDIVALRWVWEALHQPSISSLATVTLRDAANGVVRTWNVPPAATWWPTDRWQVGERWIGNPVLRLPGSIESGDYTLHLGLPGCDALAEVSLQVIAAERRWTMPDNFIAADVVLGDVVRLAGYMVGGGSVISPGSTVRVDLAWQALAEMETSYRVFVHVVGTDGRMLVQSDGEPAGWTRPTSGWAVGEIVVDEHTLDIVDSAQPGNYEIRVGLYIPDGSRLMTLNGEDFIVLRSLTVP